MAGHTHRMRTRASRRDGVKSTIGRSPVTSQTRGGSYREGRGYRVRGISRRMEVGITGGLAGSTGASEVINDECGVRLYTVVQLGNSRLPKSIEMHDASEL